MRSGGRAGLHRSLLVRGADLRRFKSYPGPSLSATIRTAGGGFPIPDGHLATTSKGATTVPLAAALDAWAIFVSYIHLRAHETVLELVCRLLL